MTYLFSSTFTARTDHSLLRWLMNVKDATGSLARWSLILQQYEFENVHRPGTSPAKITQRENLLVLVTRFFFFFFLI